MPRAVPHFPRVPNTAKPRVLLVDDHPGMLKSAAALLVDDFDVAGTAVDGASAREAARQIDPDVIVLDVNMPGLDGFQTLHALEQDGVRAPAVFLSMLDQDEAVSDAFRRGARGYVVKSRMARDLASALDHVLLGRLFVPSLTPLSAHADHGGHAMQLHGDDESFLDDVAALFDAALNRGDATCVIAPADVRDGMAGRLRRLGWDVGDVAGHQRYLAIDAADALSRFMRGAMPDAGVLVEIANELDQYRRMVTGSSTSRLTIFGNMSRVLCGQRNGDGAIALEAAWSRVTGDLPFLTLCAYPASCFHDEPGALWSQICAAHSAVSYAGNV